MMGRRIISTILKLLGSTFLMFGAAGYALSQHSHGTFDFLVSRTTSIALVAAGALCWTAAFVVRRWRTREREIDLPATCPMCGEPLEPNAGICPNCFELRTPSH